MKSNKRIIYYKDELNEEFSGIHMKFRPLGKGYKYMRTSRLFRAFEFLLYHCFLIPIVFLLQKLYWHQSFANREVLKKARKDGCFFISNHTQVQSDVFIGPLANYPKKCYIISHPHVLSLRGSRTIMRAYGVIPLGSNLDERKSFLHCMKTRLQQGRSIIMYPEASIWPYYTKIRPFASDAFYYMPRMNVPMYVLTNCYQKSRFFKRPKIVTYADGPFYPNQEVSRRDAAQELRDIAYSVMCKRTRAHSTYEYIKYIRAE